MRGFRTVFAVIFAATLVFAFTASAQMPAPAPGQGFGAHRPPLERALGSGPAGRWWNDQTMVDKLNLTDDQRKGMDSILLEHRGNLIDMHASVEKAELAMEPLMSADQPSEQSRAERLQEDICAVLSQDTAQNSASCSADKDERCRREMLNSEEYR